MARKTYTEQSNFYRYSRSAMINFTRRWNKGLIQRQLRYKPKRYWALRIGVIRNQRMKPLLNNGRKHHGR